MPKLKRLDCSNCTSLASLPEMQKLETLDCHNCPSLTSLPDMPKLTHLHCSDCPSLTSLPEMQKLETLDCHNCPSLTSLPEMPKLTHLNCSSCTSLTSLPDMPKLTHLYCSDCPSLTSLQEMPELEALYCCNCPSLTSLPEMPKLMSLDCFNTNIDTTKQINNWILKWQSIGLIAENSNHDLLFWKHVTHEIKGNMGFQYQLGIEFRNNGMACAGPFGAMQDYDKCKKSEYGSYVIAIWAKKNSINPSDIENGVYYVAQGTPVALYKANYINEEEIELKFIDGKEDCLKWIK